MGFHHSFIGVGVCLAQVCFTIARIIFHLIYRIRASVCTNRPCVAVIAQCLIPCLRAVGCGAGCAVNTSAVEQPSHLSVCKLIGGLSAIPIVFICEVITVSYDTFRI